MSLRRVHRPTPIDVTPGWGRDNEPAPRLPLGKRRVVRTSRGGAGGFHRQSRKEPKR